MIRGKHPFYWLVLAIGLILSGVFLLQAVNLVRIGGERKMQGWNAARRAGAWEINKIDPGGPAAGALQEGDRILAVNGDARLGMIGPTWALLDAPPGSAYRLAIQRGAETREFDLKLAIEPSGETRGWLLLHLAVALAFLSMGLLVGLYKPGDETARLGSLVSILASIFMFWLASNPLGGMLQGVSLKVSLALASVLPLHIVFGYLFIANFPQRVETKSFWKLITWLIVALGVMIWIPSTAINLLKALGPERSIPFLAQHQSALFFYNSIVAPLQMLFLALTFLATVGACWRNYRLMNSDDQRRRIKWVTFGFLVGNVPLIVVSIFWFFVRAFQLETNFADVILVASRLANTFIIVMPVTLAYAIVKHRVLGISVVIRLGIQYLLAKNVLRVILFLPLAGLAYVILSNPDKTLRELLLIGSARFNLALLAAAILSMRYRRQLMDWIDRRFFRSAYRKEQILLELSEKIKNLNSVAEIPELLKREIEQALRSTWISVLFWEGRRQYYSAYSTTGHHKAHNTLDLPEDESLLARLESLDSSQSWDELRNTLPEISREWLDQLGAHLLVPISGTEGKATGLLLLGEKRSEEPYTKNDRLLLEAVAAQIGIVYENLTLKERVRREQQIQADVLARLEDRQINLVKECGVCGSCYDSSAQTCAHDGAKLELTLPVERVIDGKYRLEKLIGKGGMGAVYEASDLRLNRKVAVKAMLGAMFGDSAALRRFTREAQTSAKLDHPNIVRVFDFGELHGGGAYLVMEYVVGSSWRSELNELIVFPNHLAADLLDQLLGGVEAAHRARVVHRDLKPDNILITVESDTSSPLVKILDFGLAKVRELDLADAKKLTKSGAVMGTIGYMSPEQFQGSEVDERADIYSLGVIALETLTGDLGRLGLSFHHRIADMLDRRFKFDGATAEHRALAKVLKRALSIDRNERFQNVGEMRLKLITAIEKCPPLPYVPQIQKPAADRHATHVSTLMKTLKLQEEEGTRKTQK